MAEVNIDPTKPNELKITERDKNQLTVAGVNYEWIYSLNQGDLSLSQEGNS